MAETSTGEPDGAESRVTRARERIADAARDVDWSSGVAPVDRSELADLLDQLPEMVILLDRDARIRWANRTVVETMGYRLEDALGTSMFDYIHPDDLDYNANAWENRQAHPGEVGLTVHGRGRDAQGNWRACEFAARSLSTDVDGVPTWDGLLVTMRELTGRAALSDSPATLRSLIDRTNDVVLLIGADGLLRYANRRLTTSYGHDHDRLVGEPWVTILAADDRGAAEAWLSRLVTGGDRCTARVRLRLEDPDGVTSVLEWHGTNQIADPLIRGIIVNGRDVTHLVEMEEQLRDQNEQLAHAARHDPLTGLLNRQAFVDHVDRAIDQRRSDGADGEVTLLFCDLDGFKAVNDEHGHEVGDHVLATAARRMAEAVHDDDLVARYGGDEFTVMLDGTPGSDEVARLVARLREQLSRPIELGPRTFALGASVGVASAPWQHADVDTLLREADASMYEDKRRRR